MELGRVQQLKIEKIVPHGAYLVDAGVSLPPLPEVLKDADTTIEAPHILLPQNQMAGEREGDLVTVFVYKDSEDRPIATKALPYVELGQVAELKVTQVNRIGAFLDWGLVKDLLLPYREQTKPIGEGDTVLIAPYIDKSSRLCATMKIYHYLPTNSPYKKDDRVTGLVYEVSNNFGAFVAVDGKYSALVPKKELFFPLAPGQQIEARVASVLEDGKLTLSLREKAHIQMDGDSRLILSSLRSAGGFLPYHDKSDADAIRTRFGMGKNAFKRAIGHLYKAKLIVIEEAGIRLTEQGKQ